MDGSDTGDVWWAGKNGAQKILNLHHHQLITLLLVTVYIHTYIYLSSRLSRRLRCLSKFSTMAAMIAALTGFDPLIDRRLAAAKPINSDLVNRFSN